MFKVLSSAVKVLGTAGIVIMEGMGGGRTPGNWMGEMKDKAKEVKNDAKEQAGEEAEEWGYGMDHFKGFAGSKGSPIEGFLKVMQMAVNHYCKLTPSAVPRAASILLELYFLERLKN